MGAMVILQQMAVIAILVGIGIYLYRSSRLDEHTSGRLSAIVMDVVNPALIMSIVVSGEIKATHRELLTALGIGACFYVSLCILGVIVPKILRIPKTDQKFYNMMMVYTNVGFIGIPVGRTVLDGNGMLYVIVCNIMYSLLFYTHGVMTLGGDGQKIQIKKIFSPGTVMALLTLIFVWFKISFPEVISSSITYIGNATIFLSMALLGASLARYSVKECFMEKYVWIYMAIRMICVPFALTFVLRGIGCSNDIVRAFCLMAAMPAANLPLIQAEKIGEDTGILSKGIMLTTMFSFVTVTFFMSFV